ncbi:MAG TPA: hypothetical protein ENK54_10685 [Thiotrichales bacterium]|nr:hypothetical protein [Thiotrichales bacterium]
MGRLLLLVAIVWIALLLYRSLRRPAVPAPAEEGGAVESMVRCATCGVHLPRSEAFTTGKRFFCSRSHAER